MQILEPSKDVAFQLLELGRENLPIRKLGLDMLRQLSLHHDYVTELLQDGHYLEALRYARKYKVLWPILKSFSFWWSWVFIQSIVIVVLSKGIC